MMSRWLGPTTDDSNRFLTCTLLLRAAILYLLAEFFEEEKKFVRTIPVV